jgi:serine/threonine-protein kinase RsbW
MATSKSMTIANTIEDMSRLCAEFHTFLAEAKLQSSTIYALDLALEEMITNIIKYSYDDHRDHAIKVEVELAEESVYMLIEDDGHEFDPLSQNAPDLDLDIADREVGGVGIFLTLNMVNEINYSREDNKNRLRITVNL